MTFSLRSTGGVAHLLDHQHGGVLLDHLIDRRHHAHVHHDLDDFGGLDRHLLRQLAHRHRLADRDFAHHARRRHLEAMLGVGLAAHRAAPPVARLLLLVARTDVADDVQLLPAVAGGLVVDHLARRLAGLDRGRGLALALGLLRAPALRPARRASSSAVRLRFSSSLRRRLSSSRRSRSRRSFSSRSRSARSSAALACSSVSRCRSISSC